MLQIVFRFLEEILWCNPMIQNIDLLIQKQANMMLLGVIEVFNILNNYAIMQFVSATMQFVLTIIQFVCKRFISFGLVTQCNG